MKQSSAEFIKFKMCKNDNIQVIYVKVSFNPESALDFVAKLNYSIKARAHGLFLKKETKFSEYQNKY